MAKTEKETTNVVAEPTNSVKAAKASSKTTKAKKEAKPKKSIGKIAKETISELKKVSWPTFAKVVKQTSVVIVVVLAFTLVLFGFDRLFSWLYSLLIQGVA